MAKIDQSAPGPWRLLLGEGQQAAESRLDPGQGAMVQAVWFDAGSERPGRLLLVLHHLVVDGVSWRILLPDLKASWEGVQQGRQPRLDPVGTSLRGWAQRLQAEACNEKRVAELAQWTKILETADPLLSVRALDPKRDTAASAQSLRLTLPARVTELLLTKVAALYHGRINDVLLTAFALAVAEWRRRQHRGEGSAVLIDLEGHGREELSGVDLSRTVGWFTSVFPVSLDPGVMVWEEVLAGGPSLGRALKQIKEQLRALPDNGLGYGLLRHLNVETSATLGSCAGPQIGFNYLGRFGTAQVGAQDWATAPEAGALGGGADAQMPLMHAIDVNALTLDRAEGPELGATWSWARELFSEEQVRDLSQRWFQVLEGLVSHATRTETGGFTPSDLPLVSLNQEEIEDIEFLYEENN
jgi:non-ribosomal peptide synthase protein (TIGR01720 family)